MGRTVRFRPPVRKPTISSVAVRVTDALVGTLTDFVLLQMYFTLSVGGVRTFWDGQRAAQDAHRMLEDINYKKIKRALYHLTFTGMIRRSPKRTALEVAITEAGRQRIASLLPSYRAERPWDGYVYLVSYDVPAKANARRDKLRSYIARTGGVLLQESLWLNPYNPGLLLETFMRENEIEGTVLVSRLGTDGTIGEKKLPDVTGRAYRLEEVAAGYRTFLREFAPARRVSSVEVSMRYHDALKRDPQLPFPLEPKDFPARRAYELYTRLISRRP